jgi:hypothetical protein
MAFRRRSTKHIKDITIKINEKNHSINILQLADDTTLFMSSKEEITSVLHEMEIVGSLSGLMLNRKKIQGMWVGK